MIATICHSSWTSKNLGNWTGQGIVRMLSTWVSALILGSTDGQMTAFSPWFPLRLCVSSMDCLAFCKSVPHFKKSNDTIFPYSSDATIYIFFSYSTLFQRKTVLNSPNKFSGRLSIQKVLRVETSQIKDLVSISASQTQYPVTMTQSRWEHVTVLLQVLDSACLLRSCTLNSDMLQRT